VRYLCCLPRKTPVLKALKRALHHTARTTRWHLNNKRSSATATFVITIDHGVRIFVYTEVTSRKDPIPCRYRWTAVRPQQHYHQEQGWTILNVRPFTSKAILCEICSKRFLISCTCSLRAGCLPAQNAAPAVPWNNSRAQGGATYSYNHNHNHNLNIFLLIININTLFEKAQLSSKQYQQPQPLTYTYTELTTVQPTRIRP
jgi:hypothetical protein